MAVESVTVLSASFSVWFQSCTSVKFIIVFRYSNTEIAEGATWDTMQVKNPYRMCRDRVRIAKAKLEQDLARGAKKKKGLCNYTGQKKKTKESVCSLISKKGELMATDMEKDEELLLSSSSQSSLAWQSGLPLLSSPWSSRFMWGEVKSLPLQAKSTFRTTWGSWTATSILDLKIHITEIWGNWLMLLSHCPSYLNSGQLGEVPSDWKKGNWKPVSLTSVPAKIMVKIR